jgi:hypothetical protein
MEDGCQMGRGSTPFDHQFRLEGIARRFRPDCTIYMTGQPALEIEPILIETLTEVSRTRVQSSRAATEQPT